MIKNSADRRLAEESLKESEQRFKTIFENASDGILVVDVETKRFFLGNRMMCSMLEYGRDEIRNLTVADIHPEQDLPRVLDQFEKLAKGEITLAEDIPIKRRDGSVFYADVRCERYLSFCQFLKLIQNMREILLRMDIHNSQVPDFIVTISQHAAYHPIT